MLFYEGEESSIYYAIESGFVKISSLSENGHERLLWIAGHANFIPAPQFFSHTVIIKYFYTALSDCVVYKVDRAKFLAYAHQTPSVMTEVATRMSGHYDNVLIQLDSVEQISIRSKLITTLTYLAKRLSTEDSVDIYKLDLKLTHNDFADMIGSTRETTSIELRKLMSEGGIDYSRTRFMINISKLEELNR